MVGRTRPRGARGRAVPPDPQLRPVIRSSVRRRVCPTQRSSGRRGGRRAAAACHRRSGRWITRSAPPRRVTRTRVGSCSRTLSVDEGAPGGWVAPAAGVGAADGVGVGRRRAGCWRRRRWRSRGHQGAGRRRAGFRRSATIRRSPGQPRGGIVRMSAIVAETIAVALLLPPSQTPCSPVVSSAASTPQPGAARLVRQSWLASGHQVPAWVAAPTARTPGTVAGQCVVPPASLPAAAMNRCAAGLHVAHARLHQRVGARATRIGHRRSTG